jgi:signal transduction histidine kinase
LAEIIHMEIKKKFINFQGKEGIMIIINDLTSVANEKQAQAMEHCSEVMIATTSHDLRTPINSIKNIVKTVYEEISSKQAK